VLQWLTHYVAFEALDGTGGNIAKTAAEETADQPQEDVEGHPQADVQSEAIEGDKNENTEV
jgi:hypothetical protein